MAIPHAKPGEVVDVRPLGPGLANARTEALVKTPALEIIRLILPAGKEICHHHEMVGEITIQCMEGQVAVEINSETRVLEAGQLVYLARHDPHAIRGVQDASVLLTILLR